jgi:hypothetical protein
MNEIIDMAMFVEAKSDQLNADDLIGAPRTITVRKVTGNDGDQPVAIHYEGDNGKPFKPCKTMRRVLLAVWGRNAADYVGRSMTLYRDDGVTFGGLNVGGIRISHMSHIEGSKTVVVMKSKGKKAGIEIKPLAVQTQPDPDAAMREWTAKFTARINAADTPEAVNALVAKQSAWLDKLPADLRAQCDAAVSDRMAALSPGEGRADTDHGDQHDDLPPNF